MTTRLEMIDEFEDDGAKNRGDVVETVKGRVTRGPGVNSVSSPTLHGPSQKRRRL